MRFAGIFTLVIMVVLHAGESQSFSALSYRRLANKPKFWSSPNDFRPGAKGIPVIRAPAKDGNFFPFFCSDA